MTPVIWRTVIILFKCSQSNYWEAIYWKEPLSWKIWESSFIVLLLSVRMVLVKKCQWFSFLISEFLPEREPERAPSWGRTWRPGSEVSLGDCVWRKCSLTNQGVFLGKGWELREIVCKLRFKFLAYLTIAVLPEV